jgi:hypothetical protein
MKHPPRSHTSIKPLTGEQRRESDIGNAGEVNKFGPT